MWWRVRNQHAGGADPDGPAFDSKWSANGDGGAYSHVCAGCRCRPCPNLSTGSYRRAERWQRRRSNRAADSRDATPRHSNAPVDGRRTGSYRASAHSRSDGGTSTYAAIRSYTRTGSSVHADTHAESDGYAHAATRCHTYTNSDPAADGYTDARSRAGR